MRDLRSFECYEVRKVAAVERASRTLRSYGIVPSFKPQPYEDEALTRSIWCHHGAFEVNSKQSTEYSVEIPNHNTLLRA